MNLISDDGVQPSTTQKHLNIAQKTPKTFRSEYLAGADRLVVDEFTMLSRSELNRLLELNIPIVLSGDFEQLCNPFDENPVDRQWLIDNGFLIKELTEIKRASSEETKELYTACRGQTTHQMLIECEKKNIPKRSFTVQDFPSPNERRHYIASKNEAIDKVNKDYANYLYDNNESERLGHEINGCKSVKGMLVIGVDTSTHFRNQEVGYLEGFEVTKKKIYAMVYSLITNKVVSVPVNNLSVGFAITFHRCQGQTFNFPIYVDIHNLFIKAMLYVAITRVPDIKYLCLIKGSVG
jgi:ATP-dependent exoDNAse (exonuclease V) alpha subunit